MCVDLGGSGSSNPWVRLLSLATFRQAVPNMDTLFLTRHGDMSLCSIYFFFPSGFLMTPDYNVISDD